MLENDENIVREIVQTTIRMDATLHADLRDYVYKLGKGLPKKERPSIDFVVQGMIRSGLTGTIPTEVKKLTPPEGNTGVLFMNLLESSALNSKLDTILELLEKQAHGKDQGRTDRRNTERELARLIKEETAAGRGVAAAGKPGKEVRGRSKGALQTPRTGSAG